VTPFYADPYVDAAQQHLDDLAAGVVYFRGIRCRPVDSCTCAGGGDWPHEPHCGLEPA
jgi:hypothetical protein